MKMTIIEAAEAFGTPCIIAGVTLTALPLIGIGVALLIVAAILKPKSKTPFGNYNLVATMFVAFGFLGIDALNPIPIFQSELVLAVLVTLVGSIGFIVSTVVKLVLNKRNDQNKENVE